MTKKLIYLFLIGISFSDSVSCYYDEHEVKVHFNELRVYSELPDRYNEFLDAFFHAKDFDELVLKYCKDDKKALLAYPEDLQKRLAESVSNELFDKGVYLIRGEVDNCIIYKTKYSLNSRKYGNVFVREEGGELKVIMKDLSAKDNYQVFLEALKTLPNKVVIKN